VPNILNIVFTLRFFSSKCLFHYSNVFGFCIIHITYTGVLKLKKKYFRPQKVNRLVYVMGVEGSVFFCEVGQNIYMNFKHYTSVCRIRSDVHCQVHSTFLWRCVFLLDTLKWSTILKLVPTTVYSQEYSKESSCSPSCIISTLQICQRPRILWPLFARTTQLCCLKVGTHL
jgi:hypothetical protein